MAKDKTKKVSGDLIGDHVLAGAGTTAKPSASSTKLLEAVNALAALSDEERLIAGIIESELTMRDLIAEPPGSSESMQQIGIPSGKLKGPLRHWVNVSFRAPRGKAVLTVSAIKSGTTWAQLLALL